MTIQQLEAGVSVISRDDRKLGVLSRFVVGRDSRKLTHVVVDTGILRSGTPLWEGGWGLSHDRVVPVGVLGLTGDGALRLTMTADEFRDLSVDYIDEHFEPYPDDVPGRPDLSDVGRFALSLPGEPGPWVLCESLAHAPDAVDLREDMPVWRMDPHEKIGEVERLLIDEQTQQVTALVIRRGFIFSKEVVLPMSQVTEVLPHVVRADIGDTALHALEEYAP